MILIFKTEVQYQVNTVNQLVLLDPGCCGGDKYEEQSLNFPLLGQLGSHFIHHIFLRSDISQEQP